MLNWLWELFSRSHFFFFAVSQWVIHIYFLFLFYGRSVGDLSLFMSSLISSSRLSEDLLALKCSVARTTLTEIVGAKAPFGW